MARIQGSDFKKAPFLIRRALAVVRKVFGKDLTPAKIQARVPRVFWGSVLLEMSIGKTRGISERMRSLVQLRTSALVGCPYCMDIGSAVGRKTAGLSDEEIFAAQSGNGGSFSEAEQLLLRLCERLTATPANLDNAFFVEMQKHYTEEQLIELAATVAHENFRARFNRAFDVGSDELFRPLP
jgi:AhpD family alkylhydroperoxidase